MLYPVYSTDDEGQNIDLYDENYNKIVSNIHAFNSSYTQCLFIIPPNLQPGCENAKYFQLSAGSAYGETIVLGSFVEAGDNVAWNGIEWDVLSGTVDLTGYATKEDVNTKLSSIYKYKGTVSHFSNLPTSPEIGDVYNIENGYYLSKEVKPITVTDAYTDGDYAYIFIDPGTNMPPWAFNTDGINICDKNLNVISVAAFTDIYLMRCKKDAAIEIGKQYYLEYFNITPEDLIYETGIVTVSVGINSGDNVAWTGDSWDVLSGTVDLTNYATKDEVNAKVSSVYKYKGSVLYENLPTNPTNGDVYNVINAYEKTIKVMPVTIISVNTDVYESVGSYQYTIKNQDNLLGTITDFSVTVYNTDIEELYVNCYVSSGMVWAPGYMEPGDYYFQFLSPENENCNTTKVGIIINAGDNVAWTGSEWDSLGGTIDLSNYVTKDELSDIDTGLREATFDEIDAALNDMAASYTAMKTLTEEIIVKQNALIGGEA